jgi:hypothetical protein
MHKNKAQDIFKENCQNKSYETMQVLVGKKSEGKKYKVVWLKNLCEPWLSHWRACSRAALDATCCACMQLARR